MSITVRRILKWLKWLGLGVSLLLVLVIAINFRDEAPSKEVQAFGAASEPSVQERENAFFTILGFAAPLEQNPHEQGLQVAARYEAAVAQQPYSVDIEALVIDALAPASTAAPSMASQLGDLICGGKDDGCHQQRQQETDYLATTLNTHKAMLARYEQLYSYPHFQNTLPPTLATPIPPFNLVVRAHRLLLAKVVLSARSGDIGQALTMLERDTIFWRMVLREANGLLAKMIATGQLTYNANLLSELISQNKWDTDALQGKVQSIVLPLTKEELDITPALQHEFRMAQHMFIGFAKDKGFRHNLIYMTGKESPSPVSADVLYWLFYQPNATINEAYRESLDSVAELNLPAHTFIKQLSANGPGAEPSAKLTRWNFIYNPMGKYILALEPPDFREYKARLYNLDGLLRLVKLQLKVKQEGIIHSDMVNFLKTTGDAFVDPYTGAPMQYDANEHRLYFLGIDHNLLLAKRIEVCL